MSLPIAFTPTNIEIGVVVLAIIGLLFARRILSSIKILALNAIGGLVVLLIANWFGFGVPLTPLVVVVIVLAGIPGAILLVLLSYGGFAFVPTGDSGQLLSDLFTDITQLFR